MRRFLSLTLVLLVCTYSFQFPRLRQRIAAHSFLQAATTSATGTTSSTSTSTSKPESERLQLARLRIAEAQGRVPWGTSDLLEKEVASAPSSRVNHTSVDIESILFSHGTQVTQQSIPSSRVRELSWRVAEPAVKYDPEEAANRLFAQPLRWLKRNVQIFVPITLFTAKIVGDLILRTEEQNRSRRAKEITMIISAQSPALIKAGQALASRSDLLPSEYLDELQKLQDQCPQFESLEALKVFQEEIGQDFYDVFESDDFVLKPIAAASIGQVYKARLKSNGAEVAIKIQRPNCEEAIAIDLYILRWYSSQIQSLFKIFFDRDLDLTNVIDDFGDLIYREIDYRAEAVNAQRFAELYSSIPQVFVPKVYTDVSTSKVLTMEWVNGARLNDKEALMQMGLDGTQFVDILVQCSLRQMLDNGFFHADPHAGNLIAMKSGKLCYLDFGMVSYVEASQRYSIIEAVVHLVNRDFAALTELYKKMGFIPSNVDPAPIISALENALPDVLSAPVNELNIKNVIQNLGDVMYKFPFSLPPFYIAIIRCLGVLEGLAIQVDSEFRIINDAYPYIASRLLTDQSSELQEALRQLLFKDDVPRWERLQELIEKAGATNDYDPLLAVDQLIAYLASDQGKPVLDIFTSQSIEIIDEVGTEAIEYALSAGPKMSIGSVSSTILNIFGGDKNVNLWQDDGNVNLLKIVGLITDVIVEEAVRSENPSDKLKSAYETINLVRQSTDDLDIGTVAEISRKISREPVLVASVSTIISSLLERISSKLVRRIFTPQSPQKDGGQYTKYQYS